MSQNGSAPNRYWQPMLYGLILATGIVIGFSVKTPQKDKFSQILDIIDHDYVDSSERVKLEEDAINGMLAELDPHSTYIPKQYVEYNQRQITGQYEGIGAEFFIYRDSVMIMSVVPGGPSEKAGLQPGDRLLAANGILLSGKNISSHRISDAVSGQKGSPVNASIYRRRTGKLLAFTIIRQVVEYKSVNVFYMADASTGYIKLERFSNGTHKEFTAALVKLQQAGMKHLIIDLRDNGGGLLNEAIKIANEFLHQNKSIAYTLGLHRKREDYRADGKGIFKEGKVICLINHNTASASEILAGCLQDNDRAVIVGNRSFGKGLVQEPFNLSDGSSLRLTIARYYTPSGRCIQKPYTDDITQYRNEIYRRNSASDTLIDSLQRKKGFVTVGGRPVYSKGGIIPEIILRDTIADSTEIENIAPGLFYSRMFDIFELDECASTETYLRAHYRSVTQFYKNFEVNEPTVHKFINAARKLPYLKQLKFSKKTASLVKKHLKAAFARRLFGETGYSLVLNTEEQIFSKCSEVLKNYYDILPAARAKERKFDY